MMLYLSDKLFVLFYRNMRVGSQTKFCKRVACPSAEVLLSYQTGRLGKEQKTRVVLHLNQCDFCRAELHFLSHEKIADAPCTQTAEVPAHLRQLVEAVLNHTRLNKSFPKDEIYEGESIS